MSSSKPYRSRNSGDNWWYTPKKFTVAAKAVMGGIDLDPASSIEANRVVGASGFFTKEEDGLKQEWSGRVWMNPPYSRGLIDRFVEKLLGSIRSGCVTEACVLVNNATETRWFQALLSEATAVCFLAGRIRFWHPNKPPGSPLQGQVVIYFGGGVQRFCRHFHCFGSVLTMLR